MRNLFFDLDGTLVDSKPGIILSIQYALKKLGLKVLESHELEWCIGPPIHHWFPQILPPDMQNRVEEGIQYYRDKYGERGVYESQVYPGIINLLEGLLKSGYSMFVVTSKPTKYAIPIVERTGLGKYFRGIYGSELSGVRGDKSDNIRFVLAQEKLESSNCLMIGDREHDAKGAAKNGVQCIGVSWGYGSQAELQSAGAFAFAADVSNLFQIIQNLERQ